MSDGQAKAGKIWAVAIAVGLASFAVLIFVASYETGPAALLAILIALLVAILIWIGFYRDDEGGEEQETGAAAASGPRAETGAGPAADSGAAAPRPEPDLAGSEAAGSEAAGSEAAEPGRPAPLSAPRGGKADDLKQIKGIGPKLEQLLNALGIYHFDQIAGWGAEEIAWLDSNLTGFRGRASRDNWVEQARVLAEGGSTEFSQRVRKGDVY